MENEKIENEWDTTYNGKVHHHRGQRVTCTKCGAELSTMHFACCGHLASGFAKMGPHECKIQADEPRLVGDA